jgi:IS30 family transposase
MEAQKKETARLNEKIAELASDARAMKMIRADNARLDDENKKLRRKLKALERHQTLEDLAAEYINMKAKPEQIHRKLARKYHPDHTRS